MEHDSLSLDQPDAIKGSDGAFLYYVVNNDFVRITTIGIAFLAMIFTYFGSWGTFEFLKYWFGIIGF